MARREEQAVTRVGITGHQRLADESAWGWVRSMLTSWLAELASPLVGVSSLAAGADQVFADAVLARGGQLHAVIPFENYDSRFQAAADANHYRALLQRAVAVEVLAGAATEDESYLAAGQRVVDASDLLFAVWDGRPARGLGGTADIVAYAESRGVPVRYLNPERPSTD